MDLGVREWMIIIGVLLIVAVVLDGYRRVRNERRGRIRVAVSRQVKRAARRSEPTIDDEVEPSSERSDNPELPNGGARPAGRGYRRRVPVLMDPVEVGEVEEETERQAPLAEPEPDDALQPSEPWADTDDDDLARYDWQPEQIETTAADDIEHRAVGLESDPLQTDDEATWHAADAAPGDAVDEPLDAFAEPDVLEPEPEPVARETASRSRHNEAATQEILVLYVLSRDKSGFKGQDLLQLLLACDVRYGKNNIFHRYEEAKGRGAVQFSVANLVEPGTFDLDRMDQVVTPGLCFFMTLPGPAKSITAFNYMVETAQVLVKNLGGELRDEAQSVVTAQTLEHSRQRIRDFERRQLTLHL